MKTNELSQQEMQSINGGACVASMPPSPEDSFQQDSNAYNGDATAQPMSYNDSVSPSADQGAYDEGSAPHYIR